MGTTSSSYLPQNCADFAANKKAAKAILRDWTEISVTNRLTLDQADEVDPFDMLDLVGSGSPEAKGGRAAAMEGELNEAPCHQCKMDACPGVIGECLLSSAPLTAIGATPEEVEFYHDKVGFGFFHEATGLHLSVARIFRVEPEKPKIVEPVVKRRRKVVFQAQKAA